MNENARHTISRALDENCDLLHPEQARKIIEALEANGFKIITIREVKRAPFVFDTEEEAAEAMDNGRNTGGKSYR